jgi:hypothetical protein
MLFEVSQPDRVRLNGHKALEPACSSMRSKLCRAVRAGEHKQTIVKSCAQQDGSDSRTWYQHRSHGSLIMRVTEDHEERWVPHWLRMATFDEGGVVNSLYELGDATEIRILNP